MTGSPNSDADRVIHGYRVEVKFSTMWANDGYKFQQVRDQAYDQLFCLGVTPLDAHAWLVPKAVLFEHVIGHRQHTGAGAADTAWLGFQSDNPPSGWSRTEGAFTSSPTCSAAWNTGRTSILRPR